MSDQQKEMKILTVKWDQNRIPLLYPALQRGVLVKALWGWSIRSLLCDQFGLHPDYVKNRIQTAFLNGKPVDDFDTAIVGEGSVLTLSGALPGLAGATLRKGGFFSPMRATLSHHNESGTQQEKEGFITVRIFNILLPELAPVLLTRGIYLSKEDYWSFLRDRPEKAGEPDIGEGDKGSFGSASEPGGKEEWQQAEFIQVRIPL